MGTKKRRTPQEKKRLSLERDKRKPRRSAVGRGFEAQDVVAERRSRRRVSKRVVAVGEGVSARPRPLGGRQGARKLKSKALDAWLQEREEKRERLRVLRAWQLKKAEERKRRRRGRAGA